MQEPSRESPSTARTKSIGSKVTEEEYASLERLAQNRKMTLSEWCRQLMLAQLNPEPSHALQEALLSEVLGVRIILLNAVFALSNGDRLGTDEMKELIRQADTEKLSRTMEVLSSSGLINERNEKGG
jgi:hypothetical protein